MEAVLYVGAPISFPTGGMAGSQRLGGSAVAGTDWHRGLAILLPTWTYVALTVLLFLVPFQKLQVSGATRARVAVITGLVVLSYVILVYLIFFLTYTPLDVDHVRGVQGRYFVVVLPVAAIFVAIVVNRELPNAVPAAIAITGSMIAGIATVEALFRAHW